MATLIDVGLIEGILPIFSLIFIWVGVYAVLQKTNFLTESKSIHSIFATVVAIIVLATPELLKAILIMIPWFVVILVFLMLMILVYRFLGIGEGDIATVAKDSTTVYWVLIISVIIFIAALSNVFGQNLLEQNDAQVIPINEGNQTSTATGNFDENVNATFFHPKFLGALFVLLVAVFTILTMARGPK